MTKVSCLVIGLLLCLGLDSSSAIATGGLEVQTKPETKSTYRVSLGEVEYSITTSTLSDPDDVTRVVVTSSDDLTPRTFEDWHRGPYRVFRGTTMIYERIVGGLKAEDWAVTAGNFKCSLAALPTVSGFRGSEAARDLMALERDVLVLCALQRKTSNYGLLATEVFTLLNGIRYAWGEKPLYLPKIVIHQ